MQTSAFPESEFRKTGLKLRLPIKGKLSGFPSPSSDAGFRVPGDYYHAGLPTI